MHTQSRITQGRRSVPLLLIFALARLVSLSATGIAQEQSPDALPERSTDGLPVTAVDLFSSGVGYFQHDGVVDGSATVELAFAIGDINDVLKSLVVQDFGGGSVEVSYPSHEPLSRILDSFSIDIGDNPPFAEFLLRARGEPVTVEADRVIRGTISGVESKEATVDDQRERVAYLTLMTEDGFLQISLSRVRTIQFESDALQRELQAALSVIAANRQEERKTVSIRFVGSGRRNVRVSYVRAVPVWKTSYRFVVGDDGEAQLQGWAIVENTGESDWHDVTLGLVATQPISFVMNLYDPIYRSRPQLDPPEAVTVAPQEYDRSVAPAPAARRSLERAQMQESAADTFSGSASAPGRDLDLGAGGGARAFTEPGSIYRIDEPVSISRRGAALIPIVQARIPSTEVLIFDQSVLSNRPLRGLRFTNDTVLQLPAGPATMFEKSTYVGDAQLPSTAAGETRLLSYAVDLNTVVVVEPDERPAEITRAVISDGALRVTRERRLSTQYLFNRVESAESSDSDREIVIVHPKLSGWDLVSPQGAEITEREYRITLPFEQTTAQTTVVQRQITTQAFALSSISESQLVFYLENQAINESEAAVLREVRRLRAEVEKDQQTVTELERRINNVYREQERIRSNLEVLSQSDDLYRTYLDRLSEQEQLIQALQAERDAAVEALNRSRDALAEYLGSL